MPSRKGLPKASRKRGYAKAKDFHDDPKVRGGRDRATVNWNEPWEKKYALAHKYKKVGGHRTRHRGMRGKPNSAYGLPNSFSL